MPAPARSRMKDIARVAGLSVSTVSRALSGCPHVNAETRSRVAQLASGLEYSVDQRAQGLRLRQNRTVALVVDAGAVADPGPCLVPWMELIGALSHELTDGGYEIRLSWIDLRRRQDYACGHVAGVVLLGPVDHAPWLARVAAADIPAVVWGGQVPPPQVPWSWVGVDLAGAAERATSHLFDRGARRIAFVGERGDARATGLHRGYGRAHEIRDIEPFDGGWPVAVSNAGFERWLRLHPEVDGVFAATDLDAMTAIRALRAAGRQVPDDVLVCACGDIAAAAHFDPPLSSLRGPARAAARALVEALLAMSNGAGPTHVKLAAELVVRSSSLSRATAHHD